MKNFLNSLVSKVLQSKRSESAALPVKLTQTAVVSITEKKSGIGYLMETTVDCKYGIITGVDVYPANEKESLLVLRHLERQIQNGVPMQNHQSKQFSTPHFIVDHINYLMSQAP